MLSQIQNELSALYRLEPGFDVEQFVVKRSALDDTPLERPEQVLVRHTGEWVEMSLVLDDALLEPDASWNLDRLCVAVEGVSHLLYLALAAERDAQITRLELELQAEIDKFVLLLFGGAQSSRELLASLFRDFSLREDVVGDAERSRYREANRLAHQYCSYLDSRFVQREHTGALLRELRQVYRMGGMGKLNYVSECRP